MKKRDKSDENPLKEYAKYSSIAVQMIVIILAGTFLGIKLDEYLQTKFPVCSLICILLSIFLALYTVLKDFFRKK